MVRQIPKIFLLYLQIASISICTIDLSVMVGGIDILKYFQTGKLLIIGIMQGQLLKSFNHFAFNHTANVFVSLLSREELEQLLRAIQTQKIYDRFAHLVRARILGLSLHQIDRTLYFIHFQAVSLEDLLNERCNLLAGNCEVPCLKRMLLEIESLEHKGMRMFGEEYELIKEASTQPDLPLPPIKRETIAPHCESVYQVVLACEKLKCYQQSMENMGSNYEKTTQYFYELLSLQIQMIDLYLSSIVDPLEHFAEITYRFMIYRNTVLALHNLQPFAKLSNTMQLWKNALATHYQQANMVFLEIAGFRTEQMQNESGLFTKELLLEEGYLNDYAEGLIDLSIDEDTVAYCGHSKQTFGQLYSHLQDLIVVSLRRTQEDLRVDFLENLYERIRQWHDMGLKPCTIRRIVEEMQVDQEGNYYEQDSFIETCARINGLLRPSTMRITCN